MKLHLRATWRRYPQLRTAALLALLLVIFFSRTIFTARVNSAADVLQIFPTLGVADHDPRDVQNVLMHDVALQFEPWYLHFKNSIRHGEFPLWNPYNGNGTPFVGNALTAMFYPPSWFIVLLGQKWGLLLLYATKLFAIGFFTYLFLRRLHLHEWAARTGGAAFMFAGFCMAWLYWPQTNVVFLLPLLLYLVERAVADPRDLRTYLGMSLGVALGIFGGHPETGAHIAFVLALYLAWRLLTGTRTWRERTRIVLSFGLAGAGGLLLAAVQLLPLAEYLLWHSDAIRVGRSLGAAAVLPLQFFSLNFLPDLLGNQSIPILPHRYFGPVNLNYNETTGGAVGLTVGYLALLNLLRPAWSRAALFFGGLAGIAICVVARIEPIYGLFTHLPPFDRSINERFSLVLSFSLCVLAALALSRILTGQLSLHRPAPYLVALLFLAAVAGLAIAGAGTSPTFATSTEATGIYLGYLARYLPLALGFFCAVVLALRLACSTRAVALVALLAIVVELCLRSLPYQPAIDANLRYPSTPTVRFLQSHLTYDRFVALPVDVMPPNAGLPYGLHDVRSYDAILEAGYIDAFRSYASVLGNWMDVSNLDPTYLDYVGVKYVLAHGQDDLVARLHDGLRTSKQFRAAATFGPVTVFENTHAKGRTYLASRPDFLAEPDAVGRGGSASIVDESANHVTVEADVQRDGYLVLADTYFPGWQATVDGHEQAIVRADMSLRAVPVTPGHHVVTFRYQPRSFYLGGALSGLAGLSLVTVWLLYRRRRRQARHVMAPSLT